MKFGIVTPSYNCGKFVEECLTSIHNAGFEDIHHVFIDGASTDNTLDILKKFPQVEVISEPDNGQADAINKGFKRVTGDILAWQNADDLYLPDTFSKVQKYFSANPDVDLVYGNYHTIDQNGRSIWDGTPPEFSKFMFKYGRFAPVQPTVFFRKKVWEVCGPLDESLNFCMDVDFYARAINNGFKIKKYDGFLGTFRVHNQSKTSNLENRVRHEEEYRSVLDRNFQYTYSGRLLFQFFKYRARLGRFLKLTIFPAIVGRR